MSTMASLSYCVMTSNCETYPGVFPLHGRHDRSVWSSDYILWDFLIPPHWHALLDSCHFCRFLPCLLTCLSPTTASTQTRQASC